MHVSELESLEEVNNFRRQIKEKTSCCKFKNSSELLQNAKNNPWQNS